MPSNDTRSLVVRQLPTSSPGRFVLIEVRYRVGGEDPWSFGDWEASGYYATARVFHVCDDERFIAFLGAELGMLLLVASEFDCGELNRLARELNHPPANWSVALNEMATVVARQSGAALLEPEESQSDLHQPVR
jgi:hypothetical protein